MKNYVATIDIGSNAVRLVIYDGLHRAPLRVHSERVICNLGADLARTGYLEADAVKKAQACLRRFSGLLSAMRVENVRAVATAAVRDARNGNDFIKAAQQECGLSITAIDGEEEARLSALGVLTSGFDGTGIIGDYGGGSLELIEVENGKVLHKASLPLGSHRLMAEPSRTARINMIEMHLERAGFLKRCAGRDFFAMGGAWRSMATAHMNMHKYPLRILDHYQMDGEKAAAFAALLSRQSADALEKSAGMSKKRIKDMGVAALTMERLFKKISPRKLVFSGTGLRDGLLFDQLDGATRKEDALIASCAAIARRTGRCGDDTRALEALAHWVRPLFAKQDALPAQWMTASCLLSDGGWLDHEDHQAAHAFQRTLMLPFYGIDHAGRAFLALSQYARYKGYLRHAKKDDDVTLPAHELLDGKTAGLAVTLGLAQHLGYLLTGGALELLKHAELKTTSKKLILKLEGKARLLNAEGVQEALKGLAPTLGLEASVED